MKNEHFFLIIFFPSYSLSVPMREVTFTAILSDFTSFLRDFFRTNWFLPWRAQ